MESLEFEDVSEREEGEIVEDDLEDVSDSPLSAGSPINSGKSVSSPEILNGVCLSKAGNNIVSEKPLRHPKTKWRQVLTKKQKSQNGVVKKRRSKSRKPPVIEILSDSEDEMTDPRYAKQLRDALSREPLEVSPNNSLKTRLKVFIDNSSEDEANLSALRNLALLSTFKPVQSDDVELSTKSNDALELRPSETLDCVDPELQELRSEALKSVVIKNHERRKRKATPIPDITGCDNCPADDTININKEDDQSNKKMKIDEDNVSITDCDFSSYNTDPKNPSENTETLEEDADILRAVLLASLSKNLATRSDDLKVQVPFEPPKVVVKPLIIHLDTDSDSETESVENSVKDSLQNTVSEFLMRQRAQVEANVKKKTNATHVTNVSKQNDQLNKSVMKLLPRSQQLEYHRLKQQLLNARKRVKTRRNSHRSSHSNKKEPNDTTNSTKKLPNHKTATAFTNNQTLVNNKILENSTERKSDLAMGHLQNTLDDLHITRNGSFFNRLQMKGKYRSLGPLLNKINKASCERQQNEILIKKLLQEIKIARTKLANSHQSFTNLVHQLVKAKHDIDDGVRPISAHVVHPILNEEAQKVEMKELGTTNAVIEDAACVENIRLQEPEEEQYKEPNDITKVFKEFIDDANVPKYKSPLNYRDITTDPVTIICPHDLLGICRDKECLYAHCS